MNLKKLLLSIFIFSKSVFATECFQIDSKQLATIAIRKAYTELKEKIGFISNTVGYIQATEQNFQLLHELVKETANKLNLPVPIILIFKGNLINNFNSKITGLDFRPNSFAYSLTQKLSLIIIGEELIEKLTYEELKTIITHELAKIKKYHCLKKLALKFASILAYGLPSSSKTVNLMTKTSTKTVTTNSNTTRTSSFREIKTSPRLILAPLIYLMNTLIQAKAARYFEFEADQISCEITDNHLVMINSLNKIKDMQEERYEKSLIGKFANLFSSHPTIHQRTESIKQNLKDVKTN